MARLTFGRLSDAWRGEAADFTPLLAEQLDMVGEVIGVDLASVGQSEVSTTGGRRIDIVAEGADGSEFVIENQYGRADHDHLTRGLAYAVARRARGLVLVAEEHRDEFRALAQYLNEMAELDPTRGVRVWLVEAKAVRIDDSSWAPLFSAVVEPNSFTATVEQSKQQGHPGSVENFLGQIESPTIQSACSTILDAWREPSHRRRPARNNAVILEARGPSVNGYRTVIALYGDGRVMVPFGSYDGQNSGIPIPGLTTPEFRRYADQLFGFNGSEKQARTPPGWLTIDRAGPLLDFCVRVAGEYTAAMSTASDV
jgi:hypothetical protein